MAQKTAISWTTATWNPVFGCSKVSPGCAHCYAEALALRFGFSKRPWTPEHASENVILKPHKLREPLSSRKPFDKPCMIFVNSTSDAFHELVPVDFIKQMFEIMCQASQHQFQILTKRPERLVELAPELPWPQNVWMGCSIENRRFVSRADLLRQVPAAVRFLSLEPLIGPLLEPWDDQYYGPGLDLDGIDWVIVGGESGPGYRPMRLEWAMDLWVECERRGIPFFFKQNSGPRTEMGADLLGRIVREFPEPRDRAPAAATTLFR